MDFLDFRKFELYSICSKPFSWCDFKANDSVTEQTKLVDLPLVIADRRHAILGHIIRLKNISSCNVTACYQCHRWNSHGSRLEASRRSITENLVTTSHRGWGLLHWHDMVASPWWFYLKIAATLAGQAQHEWVSECNNIIAMHIRHNICSSNFSSSFLLQFLCRNT